MRQLLEQESYALADELVEKFTRFDRLGVWCDTKRNIKETFALKGDFRGGNTPGAWISLCYGYDKTVVSVSSQLELYMDPKLGGCLRVNPGTYSVSVCGPDGKMVSLTQTPISSHDVYTLSRQTPKIDAMLNNTMHLYELVEQGLKVKLEQWNS